MKTFLEYVAEDILNKYGTDLSQLTVVFPNKRAALFLNEHLARLAGKPVWSPAYITISDLFRQLSSRHVADPIKLVCDLHKSFVAQTGINETLDHFYGWGQLLLADFDDIDKQMADADHVLANITDLHEMDDSSFLTEEQREVLRRFFSNFTDEHNSELRQRFLRLWSKLKDIYHDFNDRLATQGMAYEGALYREVVEGSTLNPPPSTLHIFVGFNVLLRVEHRLFTLLKREGKARFYWDFDDYYMPTHSDIKGGSHEAGYFISQYLADFPNELDSSDAELYHNFKRPRLLRFASASTENIQARYAATWLLEDKRRIHDGRKTAIVLCNEGLLPTIIHCLPTEVNDVNITTGYPLSQTTVAAFVNQLIALRRDGYDHQHGTFRPRQVRTLMRHPFIASASPQDSEQLQQLLFRQLPHPCQATDMLSWLCEVVMHVATTQQEKGNGMIDVIHEESLFRIYTLLNRLLTLAQSGDLQIDIVTLGRLVIQLTQSSSIPFHGEPVEGLQVMGLLETRNLDFTHLLILSAQEGNIPRGVNDTSFIPYSLRHAYGLTTPEHKTAIYSYYFHRLLQRAEDVTIVYNNSATDGQKGEMSRFLLQLMVEYPQPIQHLTLQGSINHQPSMPKPVPKPSPLAETPKSQQVFLSPTAINRFLYCQLQYYYYYICGLREYDDPEDDILDNRIFGNIFHEAARAVYSQLMEKSNLITAADIASILKKQVLIEQAVDEAFKQEVQQASLRKGGMALINRQVIIHYLRQLLTLDQKLAPFTILMLEGDVSMPLNLPPSTFNPPPSTLFIGGRIDRLDMVKDSEGRDHIRVIDYKTGAHRLKPLADVDAVFSPDSLKDHSDYYLQAILYSIIVAKEHPHTPVSPALLFIQHAGTEDYDPILHFGRAPISDIKEHEGRFTELLQQTIAQIFDATQPFVPTDNRQRCDICPFRQLCYL